MKCLARENLANVYRAGFPIQASDSVLFVLLKVWCCAEGRGS